MTTMNISLPDSLKSFVDEQVSESECGTSNEYVWRRDQDRILLRDLLLEGALSPAAATADMGYFEDLRKRVRKASRG